MRSLFAFLKRLADFFNKNRRELELAAEMDLHLQLHIEDNLRAGMTPQEARRQALLKLGGLEQTKQNYRDRRGLPLLETLLHDLRYGARMLRKTPGFTVIAVTILAFGIGSNTAVFSLIDALLLRSLAVPRPKELVHISFGPPGKPGPLSGSMFDRLRERQSCLTDLFGWTNSPMVLTENGVSRPIQAAYATGSAFPTLQLKPRLGRLLEWQDDQPGGANGFPAVRRSGWRIFAEIPELWANPSSSTDSLRPSSVSCLALSTESPWIMRPKSCCRSPLTLRFAEKRRTDSSLARYGFTSWGV